MPRPKRRNPVEPKKTIRLTLDVDEDLYEVISVAAMQARTPKTKWMIRAILAYVQQVQVGK